MSSVSGLSADHRAHARAIIVKSAKLQVAHKNQITYTQGALRMEGLRRHLTATKGQFASHGDCSSTSYWMLWDALKRPYGVRDIVNGTNWDPRATCYTGTLYKHGKTVKKDKNLKIGDLIFYGDQGGGIPEHVAVYIGGGYVFSHGSQGGPYILKLDYRTDRRMAKRYI